MIDVPDILTNEGRNPTRPYKGFRPRQAMRGFGRFTSSVHRAALILTNNSRGSQYLVVRQVLVPYYNDSVGLSHFQGAIAGTSAGSVAPIMAGEAALPGLVSTIDAATVYTPDSEFAPSGDQVTLAPTMPVSILPPNWNLIVQNVVATGNLLVMFFWEAVFADELDYFW